MKMCQALAKQRHQVTLVTKACPQRQEPSVLDDHQFYGVEPNFSILKLPRPLLYGGEFIFNWHIWRLLKDKCSRIDWVYSRNLLGAWLAAKMGHRVIFEAHGIPQGVLASKLHQSLLQSPSFQRFVVISEGLRNDFYNLELLPKNGLVVIAHDGADPPDPEKQTKPESFDVGTNGYNGINVGYVGNLYPGKGMEVVSKLSARLSDINFHVVGGTKSDIRLWQQSNSQKNLTFHGFIKPADLDGYTQKFDILLLPAQYQVVGATGKTNISRWMSPMKMFEYMATGKPIISSDLPVLREVLEDNRNALLVPPDDIEAWERAVKRLIADEALRKRLGQAAKQDLLNHYTWDARARRVLDGL